MSCRKWSYTCRAGGITRALRTLYAAYQKGVVTKKQAAEEKKAILAAYMTEHSKRSSSTVQLFLP